MTVANGKGKALVRQLMDEGKTFDEIVEATGLAPHTIDNYRYQVRRENEIIRPNGKPVQTIKMHCRFTFEQAEQIKAVAVRYGHRPSVLIERVIVTIIADDLFNAVLDVEGASPHGDP